MKNLSDFQPFSLTNIATNQIKGGVKKKRPGDGGGNVGGTPPPPGCLVP